MLFLNPRHAIRRGNVEGEVGSQWNAPPLLLPLLFFQRKDLPLNQIAAAPEEAAIDTPRANY